MLRPLLARLPRLTTCLSSTLAGSSYQPSRRPTRYPPLILPSRCASFFPSCPTDDLVSPAGRLVSPLSPFVRPWSPVTLALLRLRLAIPPCLIRCSFNPGLWSHSPVPPRPAALCLARLSYPPSNRSFVPPSNRDRAAPPLPIPPCLPLVQTWPPVKPPRRVTRLLHLPAVQPHCLNRPLPGRAARSCLPWRRSFRSAAPASRRASLVITLSHLPLVYPA